MKTSINTLLISISAMVYGFYNIALICLSGTAYLLYKTSKKIKNEEKRNRFRKVIETFNERLSHYDKKISYPIGRIYLVITIIYFAITPIINIFTPETPVFLKYFSFITAVIVFLSSEFWFMFKNANTRGNLNLIWKLAFPIVSCFYLILLIMNYIPEITKIDFLKQYLTAENRNVITAGFVIFIALRRIIDDIKKRFDINEEKYRKSWKTFSQKKEDSIKEKSIDTPA